MSRFSFSLLLLALCIALFISSTQAGTISVHLNVRDHEHEPQTQESSPTIQNHTPDISSPGDDATRQESDVQNHADYPLYSETTVAVSQPAPSPELVRVGPSPENIGQFLGNENGQIAGNKKGSAYDDVEGAAVALRMNLAGLGIATICIMGWLL